MCADTIMKLRETLIHKCTSNICRGILNSMGISFYQLWYLSGEFNKLTSVELTAFTLYNPMIPNEKLISLAPQNNSDFLLFLAHLKSQTRLNILQNCQGKERDSSLCSNHVNPLNTSRMFQSFSGPHTFLNMRYPWVEISFCLTTVPPLHPPDKQTPINAAEISL